MGSQLSLLRMALQQDIQRRISLGCSIGVFISENNLSSGCRFARIWVGLWTSHPVPAVFLKLHSLKRSNIVQHYLSESRAKRRRDLRSRKSNLCFLRRR